MRIPALLALTGLGVIAGLILSRDRVPSTTAVGSLKGVGLVNSAVPSARLLFEQFAAAGYTLESVRQADGVPRIFLTGLPNDLPEIESSDLRKAVFVKMLLPLLLAENERIRADRARLAALRERLDQGRPVRDTELVWLSGLAARYGTDERSLSELMRRVDVIPPALALGQAALETGWGTSPVAQRSQALFGQMIFRTLGNAPVGTVRPFTSLAAAVEAYALNLNTHRAYADFRARRAEMRRHGRSLDGHELALHLERYSERKHDYVRAVRGIIRANNLQPFDHARFRD